ncbi:MAG: hypothetical protein A2Y15_09865 [Clostridiales bacterium GWF2_36_10]|nr:MAG: hypothetical protein A2Y15_09865 [Clostridiales bacterium GWF2_36_10]
MGKFIKDETGISAIITALVMTIILTATALALDIGAAYVDASYAQNAADAIALSIGEYLPVEQNDQSSKTMILAAANEFALKNGVYDLKTEDVIFCGLEDGKYKSVSVSVKKTSVTKLAKIIGVDNIKITKSATVSSKPVGSIKGAVPIGITEDAYDTAMATGNTQHVILKVGGGDGVNGFYGFIVLDDSNGNAVVLEKWMKYGYEFENYVGEILPIATGDKTSVVRDGVNYRLSLCNHYVGYDGCKVAHYVEDCPRVVFVLIYRFVNTNTVEIVGFAPFILEPSNKDDEIQGSFLDINISYTEKITEKDCGTYTYRLTG